MNKDKKEKDKSITLVVSVKKQIEAIDIKIANINKNLDSLYNDKLRLILILQEYLQGLLMKEIN